MREIRIYQAGAYCVGQSLDLSAEAGQHVGIVLRMQPGDRIILFCGDNREFDAILTTVHKRKVSVTILAERIISRESPRLIHLAQAISKGERMEWVIQKAVELGVTSISPLVTIRSVVKLDEERMEKKRLQWQAIAIAACEQSGRNQVPQIKTIQSLTEYLQQSHPGLKFILHPKGAQSWRDYNFAQPELSLLVGPEGGFNPEELEQIFKAQYNPLCLGPRVLRTETAAIAALSVLQAVCGDL
ncbi:16S rRNA (uracil(1498)-N(3))-methyltransferase [Legionella fairfieldensis]|uniref:16S rRNA (uracil(1498)-N(3))-methyltransferase n=1 Tax=Legionella fairfieldensis TaxID=45064 RepID=UPI00048AD52C|nr:16S rRNA (uracil(1498)-N(3))-methyltransferase [Legionella fairfieldensis]